MRKFGQISINIWQSKKFTSLKDDAAKLFYIYAHTCQHGNAAGCYLLRIGYAAEDMGKCQEEIIEAIKACVKAQLIYYNWEESFIRIRKFLVFSQFNNEKHAIGAINAAIKAPDGLNTSELFYELLKQKKISACVKLRSQVESEIDKILRTNQSDTSIKQILNTETETHTDTKTTTKTKTKTKKESGTLARQGGDRKHRLNTNYMD